MILILTDLTFQDQMLSPEISPEEQLKQNQMMSACSQLSPYTFYQQPAAFPTNQAPQSPQSFWNNSGNMWKL
jgi:hypothetical protein